MHHRPRWKKWLFAAIKLLVLAALVWFLRDMLSSAFRDLGKHEWHVRPAWLIVAGLCYIAGLTPVALFWYQVLRATRQEVGLFETIRAWWVSQIVKYIPGKAMVLVVRTGMLRHPNLETTVVAASAFVETLTMMAVGSLMAFLIIVSANWANLSALLSTVNDWDDIVRLSRNRTVVTAVAALGMFVATGLPTWPPMMKLLVRMLGVGRFNPAAAEKLGSVAYRVLLGGWLLVAVGWVLQGLGLWATLQALDVHPSLADLPMNIATVAMATVAGFLSFIPGGAGVREIVQTELMVNDYGQGPALVATIIWRLVMLVSELLLSVTLYFSGPRGLKHKLGGKKSDAPREAN